MQVVFTNHSNEEICRAYLRSLMFSMSEKGRKEMEKEHGKVDDLIASMDFRTVKKEIHNFKEGLTEVTQPLIDDHQMISDHSPIMGCKYIKHDFRKI